MFLRHVPFNRYAASAGPPVGTTVTGYGGCGVLLTSSWVTWVLRRGRRDPDRLEAGDSLDFWRVESVEENRRLRLKAEMKLSGRAWLEFGVEEAGGKTLIRQTAIFDPFGLAGLAYWYILYPVRTLIFGKMLAAIATQAQSKQVPRT